MADALRATPPGFDEMSVKEQIDYVQFLWERIAAQVESVPVPDWHRDVIEGRLAELEANPGDGRSWEDVRAELQGRLAQRQ